MTENYRVVADNGSPHEGFGNTSQMVAMLGENLSREGLELEEIFLSQYQIGFSPAAPPASNPAPAGSGTITTRWSVPSSRPMPSSWPPRSISSTLPPR